MRLIFLYLVDNLTFLVVLSGNTLILTSKSEELSTLEDAKFLISTVPGRNLIISNGPVFRTLFEAFSNQKKIALFSRVKITTMKEV